MGWLVATIVVFVLCIIAGIIGGCIASLDSIDTLDRVLTIGMGTFIGGFVGFLLSLFPVSMAQTHWNERTISCHVIDKDRGGNDGGMRVYTSCGTFENTDSILRGKNTSADIWARIRPGHTETFHVVGWRLGLTSDFPNILEVK